MQIAKGVEWAVHSAALLAALPQGGALSAEALADFHGVPAAYMAKQMQGLSKAGLVTASRGLRGGYRLTRPPAEISLWDITAAIEGTQSAFRCTEIRRNGPCGLKAEDCKRPCPIAAAFFDAEHAWRAALQATSLADIGMKVLADAPPERMGKLLNWINQEAKR